MIHGTNTTGRRTTRSLRRVAVVGAATAVALVVGVGPGNPEQITIQAIGALNRADVLFIPRKGEAKAGLADLRRDIVARYVTNPAARVVEFDLPERDATNPSYAAGVGGWHQAIADIYAGFILDGLGEEGTGALLVWGDPSLYDSSLRIADRLEAMGLPIRVRVVPGITSLQALTALPGEARLWFGHEYTDSNLRFAATIEPDSPAVAERRAHLTPRTTPTTVALERATNPFVLAASVAFLTVTVPHTIFHVFNLQGFGVVDGAAEIATLALLALPPLIAIWSVSAPPGVGGRQAG